MSDKRSTTRLQPGPAPACTVTRRRLLAGLAGGLGVTASLDAAALGTRGERRVIFVHLVGGASQFETWDPKPGRPGGGPFQAIRTSVPGIQVSEVLPRLARQAHRFALVRSVSSSALG